MFTLRFDMRAPEGGAPATDLYMAAIDMCSWAETRATPADDVQDADLLCQPDWIPDGDGPRPFLPARRAAARLAPPHMEVAYEAACREHGHTPGPMLVPDRDTPSVTFVADDVDAAWNELGEYLLHDARAYAQWNQDNDVSAGISAARDVAELRDKFKSHRVIQTAQAIDFVRRGGMLNLSPLCGGVPPDIAWPYLKRVGDVVLPEAAGSATADGLTVAFNDLINTKGA